MTTYELAADEAREQDRAEMFARAEAQIRDEIANHDADRMAAGEICRECGESFTVKQGVPTVCTTCRGVVAVAYVGPECGVCHEAIVDPSEVTTFRRHRGPDVISHTRCVLIDAMRGLTIAAHYGVRGMRAVGR